MLFTAIPTFALSGKQDWIDSSVNLQIRKGRNHLIDHLPHLVSRLSVSRVVGLATTGDLALCGLAQERIQRTLCSRNHGKRKAPVPAF